MKQKLTTKDKFTRECDFNNYKQLHETELRVQRLERIVEGLLFWKEGSAPYNEAQDEYINDYVGD